EYRSRRSPTRLSRSTAKRSIPPEHCKRRGDDVKLCMFDLMPYRDLPADFERRYKSAYIVPVWFGAAYSDKVGQVYTATPDEMLYAAKAGLHGLCTNQHHQNVYGFMANPSIMGAVLARQTNGQNIAIIQLGSTLPSTTPPTRIAEEY